MSNDIKSILDGLKFDDNGLIPAIIRDNAGVLMMAYMNRESLEKTLDTGYTWFYSRSRKEFWNKGATSGNVQKVLDIAYDCDADCLLIHVEQTGAACHTGQKSCFYNKIAVNNAVNNIEGTEKEMDLENKGNLGETLNAVYKVILDRQQKRPEKSYTTYLFDKGQDKILKKIGEEAAEIIIASKSDNKEEVIYECGDFVYHMLVLLANHGLTLDDLARELDKRR